MNIHHYIQEIQVHLVHIHSRVLNWFNHSEEVLNYRPSNNGWTILEILEHTQLTSHYLLILIDKGASKAIRNINQLSLEEELANFHYSLDNLNEIGIHQSFSWIRPEHMEPSGNVSSNEIIDELILQLNRCLTHLNELANGEGLLYTTTMTVNNLGRLNVYEYIYFLSKHAERHIQQMENNLKEYHTTNSSTN